MEFTIGRSSLFRELSLLQGVVEKKNTIPILSNVLIETTGESVISLIATDLDVSFKSECVSDVVKPGSAVLQARKLFDIARSLPDSDVGFSKQGDGWVKITCGSSEFKIAAQAKEHFPSIPANEDWPFRLSASVMHGLINRTILAITQEESRYALNGSLLILTSDAAQMVATDGHRLAMAKVNVGQDSEIPTGEIRAIIPRKGLGEVLKLTAGSEESVEFSKDENHLFFRVGQRRLTSRLISGQFPNYELVLPKDNDKVVKLNTEELAQAIRRAAIMADERSHGIKFEFSKGKLTVSAQSADVGQAREVISVEYDEEDLGIGFNAHYISDYLGVVGSDQVTFEFKGEQSPALTYPTESGDDEFKYVVMPMRLL